MNDSTQPEFNESQFSAAPVAEKQEHITEIEMDEKMQRLQTRLSKAASDIGRCIEEDEKDKGRERQLIQMEARLLDAACEIARMDLVLSTGARPANERKM